METGVWQQAATAIAALVLCYFTYDSVPWGVPHDEHRVTGTSPAHADTRNGLIRGRILEAPQGGEVEEYLGIPFAEPPVGDLRYADPVPTAAFPDGSYDALDVKYSCIGFIDETFGDFEGSAMWNAENPLKEDCLYMNIWVPRPRKENRAVLVWIHGGGFFSGSNALWVYDGKALAAHTGVIVVSFNYRLGSFGFLSTGDGRVKGNYGLKDQKVALQWIHDNIAAFGGDPELVTLFGESSGAASVGYHMMSPESQRLFKRAIFESGSPDSHWSFMTLDQARERSRLFFENVNCPDDDSVLDCLRQLDSDVIYNNEWVDLNFLVFPWVPTVDGDFLADTPHTLLKQGRFVLKDSILGVNKDEGTYWILYALDFLSREHASPVTYEQYRQGIDAIDYDMDNQTRERIKDIYAPTNTSDVYANRDALDDVSGDRSFKCPTAELTDIFIQHGVKSYFYYLTYRASNQPWPPWMGVIHGAEIQWIFGMPMNQSRGYSLAEVDFSKKVMSYWANFAKYGDPNGPELPTWPQYTQVNPTYLEMHGDVELHARYDGPIRSAYCSQLWNAINRELYTER